MVIDRSDARGRLLDMLSRGQVHLVHLFRVQAGETTQ